MKEIDIHSRILYPRIHSIFLEWFEKEENQKQEPSPAGKQKITDYKKTMNRFGSEDRKEGGRAEVS